jgi:CrcB protein
MNGVINKILFLGIGGFIGSNARYWISVLMLRLTGGSFPFGTLTVNSIGCLLLGILAGSSAAWNISPGLKLMLGTGFLGALTTFSTFSVETVELFQKSSHLNVILNIGLNLGIGLAAAAFGIFLAQRHI